MPDIIETHELRLQLKRDEYQAFMRFFIRGCCSDNEFLDTLNPSNSINVDLSVDDAILFNDIVRQIIINYKNPLKNK